MKSILNLSIGKAYTEVVSLVCNMGIATLYKLHNYLPIGIFMYLTTEKHCSRPLRLLGNAYLFNSERGVSLCMHT